ncbi:MAG: DUF58 domain-containing protein [Verrucomicrobiota bacterium]
MDENQRQSHGYRFLPTTLVNSLSTLTIPVRRPLRGGRQSMHHSKTFGASVEFAEYRGYMPGDPIERIDWNVYARSDHYVIRQSYEEVSARSYVALDISESMNWKLNGKMTKLEYGCYLAAIIMYLMVRQGDSTTLVLFDKDVQSSHKQKSTPAGLKPMLEDLEKIETTNQGDIEASLHTLTEMISGRALVFVISDLMQEPEKVLRGLNHLAHEGKETTVFHVLDSAEVNLPMEGLYEIRDVESDERLTVDVDQIRQDYHTEVQQYLDDIRKGCVGLNMDYLLSNTNADLTKVIRERGRLK